ncbi:MAG: tRNA (guanosine(37)-N1)-methyltransferase TrmD [Armatimonadota bacterium]
MRIDIITIFPEIFTPLFTSILKRAQDKKLLSINIINLRDFTSDKHRTVDDSPYGGGAGMVMKIEPVYKAVKSIKDSSPDAKVILMCPKGKVFTQTGAVNLSKESHIIFICGHYEDIDERVRKLLVDIEISIGDYVLTGGEIPAMAVIDAVSRLLPGVIEKESLEEESFNNNLLEYPHYTRPEEFEGLKVPDILKSGNHKEIQKWRRKESLIKTYKKRPDILEKASLSEEDISILEEAKRKFNADEV